MKFQSIQLLRAVAALMVVVFHSRIAFSTEETAQLLWLPGVTDLGWRGVDLFFIISGFIIAHVIDRPDFRTGDYFWRRFWRIYPLYWIVMLVGLYYYVDRNWFAHGVEELGLVGMIKSFLIFPMEAHPFWEPGWSLEHEVLFYIIAALVAPLLGLAGLACLMVALGTIGAFFAVGWDYHLFDSAQLLFGAGIAAYLLRGSSWRRAAPLAAAGLAAAYAGHYGWAPMAGEWGTAAFAIGGAGLIVALLDAERKGWRVPKAAALVGNASFSLYLWHWLIIPFTSRWNDVGGHPELWRWIIVAVSVAAAIASFYVIERPFIGLGHRRWRSQAAPAE